LQESERWFERSCRRFAGKLILKCEYLVNLIKVERIGPQHQAGSDSLLTLRTFFKMRSMFFENSIDDSKHMGVLYGLSEVPLQSHQSADESPNV
jgi:CCR4-NOT transcription complex subunit 7/8